MSLFKDNLIVQTLRTSRLTKLAWKKNIFRIILAKWHIQQASHKNFYIRKILRQETLVNTSNTETNCGWSRSPSKSRVLLNTFFLLLKPRDLMHKNIVKKHEKKLFYNF